MEQTNELHNKILSWVFPEFASIQLWML